MTSSIRAEDWIGRVAVRRVCVTPAMVDQFVELSGDSSSIHVSDAAARQRGFDGRIVHGLLLGALVSQVIGTELPGNEGVLQDFQLSFKQPCFPGDEVVIRAEVTEVFQSVQAIVLRVKITRADGVVLASGKVQSGLR
jgi:3-hydroxybutyryl-CoA dehydratase